MTLTLAPEPMTTLDARVDAACIQLSAIDPYYVPSDIEIAAVAGVAVGVVERRMLALTDLRRPA